MSLENEREKDMKIRGKNIYVYDYDKSKKRLIDCSIWSDENGNYYKPIELSYNLKYHSFCNIS